MVVVVVVVVGGLACAHAPVTSRAHTLSLESTDQVLRITLQHDILLDPS